MNVNLLLCICIYALKAVGVACFCGEFVQLAMAMEIPYVAVLAQAVPTHLQASLSVGQRKSLGCGHGPSAGAMHRKIFKMAGLLDTLHIFAIGDSLVRRFYGDLFGRLFFGDQEVAFAEAFPRLQSLVHLVQQIAPEALAPKSDAHEGVPLVAIFLFYMKHAFRLGDDEYPFCAHNLFRMLCEQNGGVVLEEEYLFSAEYLALCKTRLLPQLRRQGKPETVSFLRNEIAECTKRAALCAGEAATRRCYTQTTCLRRRARTKAFILYQHRMPGDYHADFAWLLGLLSERSGILAGKLVLEYVLVERCLVPAPS